MTVIDSTAFPIDDSFNETMLLSYLQNNIFENDSINEERENAFLQEAYNESIKLTSSFLSIVQNHLKYKDNLDDDPDDDYAHHVINSTDKFMSDYKSLLKRVSNNRELAKRIVLCWISMLGKLEKGAAKNSDPNFHGISQKLYVAGSKAGQDF